MTPTFPSTRIALTIIVEPTRNPETTYGRSRGPAQGDL
jgi:hypothetical protein